jgi:hypothetical protein
MTEKADILLSHSASSAKLDIQGGNFRIRLGNTGQLNWLSEATKHGSGDLSSFSKLLRTHSELRKSGKHVLASFEFRHQGKDRSLIGELSKPIKIARNGSVILQGKAQKDLAPSGELDYIDIVGEELANAHNRHNSRDYRISSGKLITRISTFTPKELSRLIGGPNGTIPNTYALSPEDISSRFRLTSLGSEQETDSSKLSLDPLVISKDIPFGSAILNAKVSLTPTIAATLNTPDILHLTKVDDYSIDFGLGLNWEADLTLQTGSANGTFQLPNTTIPGSNQGFGTFPLTGQINSGLNFTSSTITLPGLSGSYSFGAKQAKLGGNFTVNTNGVSTENNSTQVIPTAPQHDPITGLQLKLNSELFIDLEAGLGIPQDFVIESLRGDSLAEVNGKLSVPLTFDLAFGSSQMFEVSMQGVMNAVMDAFTFNDAWKKTLNLYSGTLLGPWNSGNLF